MKITLATKITISRILLIVPTAIVFIAAQFTAGSIYTALTAVAAVILAVACSTDFIDGSVARRTHTITDLGKFLDPLVDKVIVAVMLFLLVAFNKGLDLGGKFAHNYLVIALLGGIIIMRELMIGTLRAMGAKQGTEIASDILGKIKTIIMDVSIVALTLADLHLVFAYVGTILLYIGALMTVVSGVNYIVKHKDVIVIAAAVKKEDTSDSSCAKENAEDGTNASTDSADGEISE